MEPIGINTLHLFIGTFLAYGLARYMYQNDIYAHYCNSFLETSKLIPFSSFHRQRAPGSSPDFRMWKSSLLNHCPIRIFRGLFCP
jgi:hypothetical protein